VPGTSRHNVGEAADLKLAFGALTGKFDPDAVRRKADVARYFNGYALRVAGLCGSPPGDLGHVELPYSPGVTPDPLTGDLIELPPRCNFGPGPGTARRGATARATRKRRRANRKSGAALTAARKKVDALGRYFAERSLTDEYVDWSTGACRKRGKGVLCKLTVHGEGSAPYDCRTQVGVVKKGSRLVTLLYGRKTRCR
jgi:hypothetical protein